MHLLCGNPSSPCQHYSLNSGLLSEGGLSTLAMCGMPILSFIIRVCGIECTPTLIPIDSLCLVLPYCNIQQTCKEKYGCKRFGSESSVFLLSSLNTEADGDSRNLVLLVPPWKSLQKSCYIPSIRPTVCCLLLVLTKWRPRQNTLRVLITCRLDSSSHHSKPPTLDRSWNLATGELCCSSLCGGFCPFLFPLSTNFSANLVSSLPRCANAVCYPLGNCQVPLWRWGVGLVLIF